MRPSILSATNTVGLFISMRINPSGTYIDITNNTIDNILNNKDYKVKIIDEVSRRHPVGSRRLFRKPKGGRPSPPTRDMY